VWEAEGGAERIHPRMVESLDGTAEFMAARRMFFSTSSIIEVNHGNVHGSVTFQHMVNSERQKGI